jgi:PAS domain S-box-containing protein
MKKDTFAFWNLDVGIVVCDRAGSIHFINTAARHMLGVTERKRAGTISLSSLCPGFETLPGSEMASLKICSVSETGTNLVVLGIPQHVEGNPGGTLLLLVPRDRLEGDVIADTRAFSATPEGLSAIIENTYDGLYITDGNANTLMINKAYERITGMKRQEVLGRNMKDLVYSGVIDRSVSLEVIEKKQPVTIMQELRGGKKILVTGSPVFDEATGDIILVITNVRDMTELMELKDQLHERTLEANRYLAELDKIKTLQQQKARFITKSRRMSEILDTTIRAAQFDSNILVTGESGVGKGLLAVLIHEASSRKAHPFLTINCAGIPEDLFESELFGYEPGAFSGASAKGKKGLLEVADQGTVFLDEIGDMSLRLQAKLLRVIEEKVMTRLGSTKTIKLNVRIIAATNQDIPALITAKKFRQDLFFRLNTISLVIPPLRERREDVMPLTHYFTERFNERYNLKKGFNTQAIQILMSYPFPGNVRELSNIVEQAFLISRNDQIAVDDLPLQVKSLADKQGFVIPGEDRPYNEIVDLMEYKILKNALDKYGSTHKAAKQLGVSQSTIVRKMKKLQMKMDDAP